MPHRGGVRTRIPQSFQLLAQSNALVAQRQAQADAERRAAKQQRQQALLTLALAVGGGVAAGPLGVSVASGAAFGASAANLLGPRPNPNAAIQLGIQGVGLGERAEDRSRQAGAREAFAEAIGPQGPGPGNFVTPEGGADLTPSQAGAPPRRPVDPRELARALVQSGDLRGAAQILQSIQPQGRTQQLTPAQTTAGGFLPGTVVQEGPLGKRSVVQGPAAGGKAPQIFDVTDAQGALLLHENGTPVGNGLPFQEAKALAAGIPDARVRKFSGKIRTDDGKPAVREQKITDLIGEFGLSRAEAVEIADGIKRIELTEAGFARLINTRTGTVEEISIGGAERADSTVVKNLAAGADQISAESQIPLTLWDAADDAAGLGPVLGELYADVVGQIPGMPIPEKIVDARSFYRQAVRSLVKALSNNPRFPVGEMKAIERAVDIEPGIFDSPPALRVKLRRLDKTLVDRIENEKRVASDPNSPTEMRVAASRAIEDMSNFRRLIGVPENTTQTTPASSSSSLSKSEQTELTGLMNLDITGMSPNELDKATDRLRELRQKKAGQ